MGLPQTAARGALVTLVGQLFKFVVQMATLVILARLLTPGDYGVITMITAITGIALILGDFGLSMAAVQAKSLSQKQKSNLFWINSSIGLLSATAVFFLAGPIAAFYNEPALVGLSRFLAITFLMNGLTTQFKAELTRNLRFKVLSLAEVSAQAIGLAVAVVSALAGLAYWALAFQQVSIALAILVIVGIMSRWRPSLPARRSEMRGLLSFGANTMGVQLITYISSNVDSVSLGRFWGSVVLGLYNRAFQIFALPMQQLAAPMTRVALPVLSRIDNQDQYRRYVERAQLILSYVLIGAFMMLASLGYPLFSILFGPQWVSAVPIFQILALGGIFQALAYVYYWIFLSKGLTWLQLRFSLIGRGVMVVLILLGVPWGGIGVAVGYSLGLVVIWGLYSIFAIRHADLKTGPLILIAARPVAAFTVMLVAAQTVQFFFGSEWNSWLLLGAEIAVCLLVIGAACLIPAYRRDVMTLASTARLLRADTR
ncbi:lipopolysaccharide biosynthesis protein [Subtercola boreus]|nr:lipopolysaccharide biosynthesis protein [Subtercola boreus]